MKFATVILIAALSLTGCATSSTENTAATKAETNDGKKCTVVKTTGGRLGRRVCTNE
ncbi:MAG: hypothetical protein AAF465_07825 [Pseudomonadota bacterium]